MKLGSACLVSFAARIVFKILISNSNRNLFKAPLNFLRGVGIRLLTEDMRDVIFIRIHMFIIKVSDFASSNHAQKKKRKIVIQTFFLWYSLFIDDESNCEITSVF